MDLTSQIIGIESGGNANARNPRSSAGGLGQFLDATWIEMLTKHRPDLVQGQSREGLLNLKFDPELSRAMTKAYSDENAAFLARNGFEATPGNTYLAHFAGPKGAVKVLSSDPNSPVSAVLGDGVVRANPFLANMTVADLQGWAGRKMGGAVPQPQAPQASPQAPQVAQATTQPPNQPSPYQGSFPAFSASPMPQIAQPEMQHLALMKRPSFRHLQRRT